MKSILAIATLSALLACGTDSPNAAQEPTAPSANSVHVRLSVQSR